MAEEINIYWDKAQTKICERFSVDENNRENWDHERFYESGQLIDRVHFRNGLREGVYESYHENGQPFIKSGYKNDNPHGPVAIFYENGQLKETYAYNDGKKEGPYVKYDESGRVIQKGHYEGGKFIADVPAKPALQRRPVNDGR